MRFYDIQITIPEEGKNKEQLIQFTSHKNGVYNPGALMVEFDILRFGESTPQGETHLTIWGIGPVQMQQARQNWYGKKIKIFAGMAKGLPLAGSYGEPKLAIEGTINQVYGNWQGTEMRLDFIIYAGPVSNPPTGKLLPLTLTLPWGMKQKLSSALAQCFMNLSGFTYNISISDHLVLNYERKMFCGSLTDLARDLRSFSLSQIKKPGYSGVEISIVNGNEIRVWDNDYDNHPDKTSKTSATSRSKNPIILKFTDLIGQPTWIAFNIVSVICVMRADIQTGDHILMPEKSSPMIQASSYSQYREDSAFSGEFEVISVRFLGNSRQPNAESWITVIEANVAQKVNN